MLVDVSEEQSFALAEQAGRCRRLAEAMYHRDTSNDLVDSWPSGSIKPLPTSAPARRTSHSNSSFNRRPRRRR